MPDATPPSLETLAQDLLAAASRAGAQAADVLVVNGTSLTIGVRGGALEQAERSEGIELGLRVLIGHRQACVSASDTRADTLAEMAQRAVAMARLAPEDPYCGLAAPEALSPLRDADGLELCDPAPEPSGSLLQEMALQCEAAALGVKGISQVQSASAGLSRRDVHLATSHGFAGGYARSDHGLSCVAITGSGTAMERDYHGDGRIHFADLLSPDEIGRIAAERTIARAGARKPKTGAYPVLFDERISSSLIGHLLSAINGAAIARGASWLADAMGQAVLPKGLDLIDDPTRKRVSGSRPFDGEGLPCAPRHMVRDGLLESWVLDLATARKLGLASTAHATRGVASPPAPAAGNITLTQGTQSQADLIVQMGTGLLVTGLIGSSINPTTGDYSRGASGFWVEKGEIAYPVNECTIAGNLREMLMSIIPANDARGHLSRIVPSLLVEGLTLAGE